MMHFVGTSHGTCIKIIGISEHFETLVYKNVVNHKISKTIGENSKTNSQPNFKYPVAPQKEKSHTNKGINNKKRIVTFKP